MTLKNWFWLFASGSNVSVSGVERADLWAGSKPPTGRSPDLAFRFAVLGIFCKKRKKLQKYKQILERMSPSTIAPYHMRKCSQKPFDLIHAINVPGI